MVNKKIIILLALILLIAGGLLYFYYPLDTPEKQNLLTVSGTVEVEEVNISFEIGGQIEEKFVDEGETISRGMKLAVLNTDKLTHQLNLQKSRRRQARARLDELLAGSRKEEIRQAENRVAELKSELNYQKKNLDAKNLSTSEG